MDDILEQFEVDGLVVKICLDPEPESPDQWENDNGVLIVTTRNRYFDVTPKGWNASELEAIFKACDTQTRKYKHDGQYYHVRRLYAYIHSGVALSLGRAGQFADQWDSGLIGAVCIKVGVVGHGWKHGITACAVNLISTWNDYLSGSVYGYLIEDKEETLIDSCWGFYGLDYCKEQAIVAAKGHSIQDV